jgi:FemAB-related protein (PEP-CTERM system-associated)
MSIAVQLFTEGDRSRWDSFVLQHDQATAFHLIAWKTCIEESFGYKPQYMLATENGRVRGVLPLFLIENIILKRALISSPFAVYGGILADSEEARLAIASEVRRLGDSLGVEYIELRGGHREQIAGEPNVDRYVTFTKPLSPTEAGLMESLNTKMRTKVRKVLKTPFTMQISREIDEFERIHSVTMRRLGTPCFPKQYFARILKHFGDMADIREVIYEGRVVTSSLNFLFRGEMHTYYSGTDPDFMTSDPNTFMFYDHMRWAGQNGFKTFEFGRSKKGTGPFEFKRHWGTEMRELPYEVVLVRKKEVPNYSPTNKNFELAINLWRNVPLVVARAVGPRLLRLFP